MNIFTHTLLPIVGVQVFQRTKTIGPDAYWDRKKIFWVGFFGALPDLLNPHLSLEARYSSWSHGIPAIFAIPILLLIFRSLAHKKIDTKLILWLSGAYLFHSFSDMISGGIALLYPFHSSVIGDYYISPIWWFHIDFACVFTAYLLYRIMLKKRKIDPASKTPPI